MGSFTAPSSVMSGPRGGRWRRAVHLAGDRVLELRHELSPDGRQLLVRGKAILAVPSRLDQDGPDADQRDDLVGCGAGPLLEAVGERLVADAGRAAPSR